MSEPRLILDHVYEHEVGQPDRVFLTQPTGGGQVVDYSWAQSLDQSRRMAAHLKSLQLPPGARIAMLAKNSAHFFIAELAIWMAGGTTVAIFPTETADNVRYVLQHSEASLLFIGKLDTWAQQRGGVPAGLPCIALPLAPVLEPDVGAERWDDIVARTAPLPGRPARWADDLAMLLYTSGSTGQPKGVMQSFRSITAATNGILRRAGRADAIDAERACDFIALAHCFGARLDRMFVIDRRQHPGLFQRIAGHFHVRHPARGPPVHLGAAPVDQVPAGGAGADAGRPAGCRAGQPGHGSRGGQESAGRPGAGAGVRAVARRPYPPSCCAGTGAWPDLYEGYAMTEDFSLFARASPVRRRWAWPAALRRCAPHRRRRRGAGEVAGPDGRLLLPSWREPTADGFFEPVTPAVTMNRASWC
jgi:hypothetical protein